MRFIVVPEVSGSWQQNTWTAESDLDLGVKLMYQLENFLPEDGDDQRDLRKQWLYHEYGFQEISVFDALKDGIIESPNTQDIQLLLRDYIEEALLKRTAIDVAYGPHIEFDRLKYVTRDLLAAVYYVRGLQEVSQGDLEVSVDINFRTKS